MKKIANKYRILKKLGEGFGGQVFLAEAEGQRVALKQLLMDQTILTPEENLENFRSEFTVLSKLSHPHIVKILDFGYDEGENFYYFTTEYLEGSNIFEATRELSPHEIEELFVQIFRALSYLHSQKVFHLDIKPQNILVHQDKDGQQIAKLIDFGLVAFQSRGMLVGSPPYLAPEALAGETRDGRYDLYSLGVTWYECLTGINPFRSETREKTFELQKIWNPPPVSKQSPGIPDYLDPILEKLLRKNPAERYHRADQVIRDLNWIGDQHYPLETEATALSYLPGEGSLVGREKEWAEIVSLFDRVFVTKLERSVIALILGQHGTGKTRLLREIKYYAQLHTIPVHDLRSASSDDLKKDGLLIADDVTQELLETISQAPWQLRTSSSMVVLAGENLRERSGIECKIILKNFDHETVARYTSSVLGIPDPPVSLINELFARTEGNPLFLTELLHSLINSQQIFDEQGRWSSTMLQSLGVNFENLSVPKTLSDYCQIKYAQLSPTAQKILNLISLSHVSLDRRHLTKLGFGTDKESLESLRDNNLLTLDPTTGEIKLLNPSLRDWILKNLEELERASVHQSLGELFQEEELNEAAMFHLGHGTLPAEERFQHLMQLGDLLQKQNRWSDAVKTFEDASQIARNAEQATQSYFRKAFAVFRTGNNTDALKILEGAQTILKKEREDPNRWHWVQQTYREMGSIYLKMRKSDLARESIEASRVLLEEHEDNPVEEMILTNLKASVFLLEGKTPDAIGIFEKTQKYWEKMPFDQKKEIRNNELGSLYLLMGTYEEAKKVYSTQATFFQETGNLAKQAYSLYGLAEAYCALEQFDQAASIYESCLKISRELKNEELMFHVFNGLGNIGHMQKNWGSASESYQKALELAQHVGDFDGSIGIAINLASIYRIQGDQNRSLLYLKQIIETLEEKQSLSLHQLQFLTQAYLEQGELFAASRDWVDSYVAYHDALRIIRRHPTLKRFRTTAALGLTQADIRLDKVQEAQNMVIELERETLTSQEKSLLEKAKKSIEAKITTSNIASRH